MSNTSYTVQEVAEDGTVTEITTRGRKDSAIDFATLHHLEKDGTVLVQVVTGAGHVVHEIPVAESAEEEVEILAEADAPEAVVAEASKRAKPWSRTDEAKSFEAPQREGYTLAYTRERTKTAIYRANDKSGWLILDTRDGTEYTSVNTHDGRMITNRLQDEYQAQVTAAREQAKADRKTARDEAKAAREEAAVEKAAAKSEAAKEKAEAAQELDGASASA